MRETGKKFKVLIGREKITENYILPKFSRISMKKKADLIWAGLLVLTALIFFYLGNKTGSIEAGEDLTNQIQNSNETISALESKLQQLSDELTSRGIYRYPQAHVIAEENDSNATVLINLNGRDAIRNLVIERRLISNYSAMTQDPDIQPTSTKASIGTLTAHNPCLLYTSPSPRDS